MVGDAEPRLHDLGQVFQCVGRDAVDLGIGAFDDDLAELGLLRSCKLAAATRLGPIVEAGKPLSVVALDRITERLALDADYPRRIREAHAVHGIGDPQHAPRRPRYPLASRPPPQLAGCVQIVPDRCSRCHGLPPESLLGWHSMNHNNTLM